MVEKKKNLSEISSFKLSPTLKKRSIAIIYSEWNSEVTESLKKGAYQTLLEYGIKKQQIKVYSVPGSFELPIAASMVLHNDLTIDAVFCLGCVIQGETRHFEFISQAVANGIMHLGTICIVPVIFGVLTCDTMQQALDRAGGEHGNKGVEAAVSCLKMLTLQEQII